MAKKKFKIHPALLTHTIQRQAGTLTKAVLEGVMNAVDAIEALPARQQKKAREFGIRIDWPEDSPTFYIEDRGCGFRGQKEIDRYFNTFGAPQDETEKKKFGYFRMGRGQLFAFGKNIWRSGNYRMEVDIAADGDSWELTRVPEKQPGCRIAVTVYDRPRAVSMRNSILYWLPDYLRYLDVPVFVNDKQVTVSPDTETWDVITDDAYIRLNDRAGLDVFNMGIRVTAYATRQYGWGGTILSKKALQLNYARNDIMDTCPVWQRITRTIKEVAQQRLLKNKKLDCSSAAFVLRELAAGKIPLTAVARTKFLMDIDGKFWSLPAMKKQAPEIVTCGTGNEESFGSYLIHSQQAWVAHPEWLEEAKMSIQQLVSELYRWTGRRFVATEWATLRSRTNWDMRILPEDSYRIDERIVAKVLQIAHRRLIVPGSNIPRQGRKILIGDAATADAWTDGRSYIAIARHVVDRLGIGASAWPSYLALVAHELCHVERSNTAHKHPPEFFQDFHDMLLSGQRFQEACRAALSAACRVIETEGKKMPRRIWDAYCQQDIATPAGVVD